jgi:Ca2+-binding EF-hand superfamily protein
MDNKNTEARDLLRDVFNKMDKNGNGFLDLTEAASVLKEIGQTPNEEDLKKFFEAVDANHDGEISFDELYAWFTSSKSGAPLQDAFKIKVLGMMKKTKKEIAKLSEILKGEQSGMDHHHFGVKVGNVDQPKTKFEVSAYGGTEAESKWADVSKGIDLGDVGVVIQFHSTQPEAAKDEILALLEGGKEMLREIAQGAPVDIDGIQFQGAVDGEHVNIGIRYDDPNVLMVAEQFRFLLAMMVPGDFTSKVSLQVHLNKSLEDIFKEEVEGGQEKDLLLHVLEGISVSVDATLTNQLIEVARNQVIAGSSFKELPIQLRSIVPLLFLKGSQVQLDFASSDACPFSQLFPKVKLGFKQLIEMAKSQPLDQFIGMIPPLQQLVDLCESKLLANLKIAVRGPKTLAVVHIKTSGVDKIWNYIKPQ